MLSGPATCCNLLQPAATCCNLPVFRTYVLEGLKLCCAITPSKVTEIEPWRWAHRPWNMAHILGFPSLLILLLREFMARKDRKVNLVNFVFKWSGLSMLKIGKESLKPVLNTSALLSSRASSTCSVTSLSLRGPPRGSSLVMDTTTSSPSWWLVGYRMHRMNRMKRLNPACGGPNSTNTQTTNDLKDLSEKDVKTTK